ncbi:MAG: hypothetical protein EA352_04055 [Gemmatimonadales bacterium]|nr:MAG: hypothetical protein EA352_04055 [Gemmatimonadales bacterium]
MSHRLLVLLSVVVLAGVGLGLPEALGAQTPNRPEVTSLSFEGNRAFPDRALAGAIATRPTQCRSLLLQAFCWFDAEFALDRATLNPRAFDLDRVRLFAYYYQRGYREVQVDTVLTRRAELELDIAFRITEGEPVRVRTFDVTGIDELEGIDPSALRSGLPIQVGDPMNRIEIQAAQDTLTGRLQDRGYPEAEVFPNLFIPSGTRDGEVELDVFAGSRATFGRIEVTGNEEVEEAVILRMLPFGEGDVYSRELILQGQRNLYGLDIFRQVSVTRGLEGDPDSIVSVRVQVGEGDTHRVRAGGGWNTADCFTTEARWASRNFLGGARRLQVRGRTSNLLAPTLEDSICSGAGTGDFARLNWLASVEFVQPWIFSPRNTLNATAFAERASVPDVYIREGLGLTVGLTRIVGRDSPASLSYQPQLSSLSAADVFFCTNFLVCSTAEIVVLEAGNRLAPLTLGFSRDQTDRAVSPTRGYTVAGEVSHASRFTLSDFDYERVVAEATWFQSLPRDVVLGTRIRGGWLGASSFRGFRGTDREGQAIAHPQTRFYAGGANSVRGYPQNQLGPEVVTATVEDLVFPAPGSENGAAGAICSPQEVADRSCDPAGLDPDRVQARPTGGSAVLEGNLELRFPIRNSDLGGVAFVDFGQVWAEPSDLDEGDIVFTPGIGLRYSTPIGPIRVDIAYRPAARLVRPVVTSSIRPFRVGDDPDRRLVDPETSEPIDWVVQDELARLDQPLITEEDRGFGLRRLQFQFSIGHAF